MLAFCVFGQLNAWFEDWLTTRRSPEPGADVTHSLPTVQELVPPCQVCSLLLLLYLYCNCSSACFALRNTVLLSITVLYIGVIVCRPASAPVLLLNLLYVDWYLSLLESLLNYWPKPIILPRTCFKGYSIQCDHSRISSQGDILLLTTVVHWGTFSTADPNPFSCLAPVSRDILFSVTTAGFLRMFQLLRATFCVLGCHLLQLVHESFKPFSIYCCYTAYYYCFFWVHASAE